MFNVLSKSSLLLNKNSPLPSLNNAELGIILKESLYHSLTNLAYLTIKTSDRYKELIGYPAFAKLKNNYMMTVKDNMLKQKEFIDIQNVFETADIPLVPIKGVALLFDIFQSDLSRPMVDIDILIKKNDLEKAKQLMQGLGYKAALGNFSEEYYTDHYHHLPFFSTYMAELHWDLAVPRPNKIILPELWNRLQKIEHDNAFLNILSPEDTIFSLTLHLRRFNKPFSLKPIYDIYKIMEKYDKKIDWTYISKYSRLNRLNSIVYYSLASVKIIFGYPVSKKELGMFYPGILRASLLKLFINRVKDKGVMRLIESASFRKCAYIFLRILLYDYLWEFIKFIIFIPEEEFSRFYSIKFPSRKSSTIYNLRFLAMPFLLFSARSSKKSSI
nr:nucleotidyltransferase family protein [Candidatus Omnitrophota bacterium]